MLDRTTSQFGYELWWNAALTTILIKNGTIATQRMDSMTIKDGGLAIEDGRIVAVGRSDRLTADYGRSELVIDAKGGLVLPGLVNMHTHMFQSLFRGLGDDLALIDWLRKMLYPYTLKLNVKAIRAAAELSCLEMILTGVTTVVDNHSFRTSTEMVETVCDVIMRSGLRGVVARGMRARTENSRRLGFSEEVYEYDEDEEVKLTERLVKKWSKNGRVMVCPAPVTIFSSTPRLLREARRIALENDVPFHIHVAESLDEVKSTLRAFKCREVEYLAKQKVLGRLVHIVHGVWLDQREIGLLAESGSNVIHCPVSNMYLASGVAPVRDLLRARINIGLGTDGPASNNSLDMFEVMKSTALLCKVSTRNPKSITANQVLRMATVGGAKALGLESEISSLEPGKRADVIILDLHLPYTMPVHNAASAAVYCATHSNVSSVIADGNPLMVEGKLTALDQERVLCNADEAVRETLGGQRSVDT